MDDSQLKDLENKMSPNPDASIELHIKLMNDKTKTITARASSSAREIKKVIYQNDMETQEYLPEQTVLEYQGVVIPNNRTLG